MSVNKIDGETQLGCAPMLVIFGIIALIYAISERINDHTKRLDAIEKALAAKEAPK